MMRKAAAAAVVGVVVALVVLVLGGHVLIGRYSQALEAAQKAEEAVQKAEQERDMWKANAEAVNELYGAELERVRRLDVALEAIRKRELAAAVEQRRAAAELRRLMEANREVRERTPERLRRWIREFTGRKEQAERAP